MIRHNYNTQPVLDNVQRRSKVQAPLEQKIKQYLDLERDIRLLEVELLSLQSAKSDFNPAQDDLEQEMHDSLSYDNLNDKEQMHAEMLEQYSNLRNEVIQMLPGKNKFVEISMGYGPGMIGYFTIDPETHEPLPEPILRVLP